MMPRLMATMFYEESGAIEKVAPLDFFISSNFRQDKPQGFVNLGDEDVEEQQGCTAANAVQDGIIDGGDGLEATRHEAVEC